MINFNGTLIPEESPILSADNRAFKFGDGIFDTLKSFRNNIYFIEDHYFRLMSSMRMLRMEIPMDFTLQYYKDQIVKTLQANHLSILARIRVSVFRKPGGFYAPKTNEIDFLIEVSSLQYIENQNCEIELYKDFSLQSGILSTIKTNNKMLHVLAGIFATENGFDNCVLINEKKNLTEAMNANVFLVKGNTVFTPPLEDGCINGIVRKQVLRILEKFDSLELQEVSISPFELMKADEVFLTNSIFDIQSVTKYRKKIYTTARTQEIRKKYNNRLTDQIAI
ncbi:aminotransferase class IV [Namhaeicola litoreus]|uniref:branched-chain-amino-acid transaminase n=1 Tax=Namhaeicola litoreus TaxID=1052145 RepID=A0ABW3Y5M4_9FLAO